jgi:rSAM/selenodomain-associated transferase 2
VTGAGTRTSRPPSIAVVVPTLDERAALPVLLDSLARGADGDRPDELVVADGGSRDGTAELAAARDVALVRSRPGRGAQLAAGARHARADVLLFLHADTWVEPDSIAALRRAFAHGGAAERAVASGMRQRVDHPGGLYRWVERAADLRVRAGRVYGDSGLAVRREAYVASGGFRELPLFEDLDLSRRLRALGRIAFVRDAVLHVSPRRWLAEGPVRRTVRNWALTAAWAAGVDPARLVRYYPPHSGAAGEP